MTTMEVKSFLKLQARQYKKHQDTVKTTEATLDKQYRIQRNRTIPKVHRPKPPSVVNSNGKFAQDFNKQYATLFFECLQEAILQNTITLELEKSRCLDILMQTEKQLHLATEPPQLIAKLYANFLEQLHVKDHEISPELQQKFQAIHPSSPSPQANTQNKSSKKKKSRRPFNQRKVRQPPKGTTSNNDDTSVKRKCTTSHPPAKKQLRIDHFLVKGHELTPDPT